MKHIKKIFPKKNSIFLFLKFSYLALVVSSFIYEKVIFLYSFKYNHIEHFRSTVAARDFDNVKIKTR